MRRRTPARVLFTIALSFLLPGCARALREAPPLTDLAAGLPLATPEEVDRLLAESAALYRRRDLESVRGAAEIAFRAAAADPSRTEAVVAAVRAQVWLADHEPDPARREGAATLAVQAAQWCGRGGANPAGPLPAACSFWLGAALGVQARERPSTGLSALPLIEAAFREAAASDPSLEEGGPDRALALLYLRAPGWPAGPGDPDRGLQHARKAIGISPGYPPNLMALAEALAATGDREGSREQYRLALERAREAAGKGDPDAPEWVREAEGAAGVPDRG